MKFKTFQLIIDSKFPQKSDIYNIPVKGLSVFHKGVELFEIENQILKDRFLFMSCQYDNAELYTDTVWNEDAKKKEQNPRRKNQIECRKQLFVCYDTDKQLLYMSDMAQRGFLKKYISEILNKDVEIKNIIHSLEDFENAVRTLKRATFIQARNLMNVVEDSMFERTANIYGLNAPERLLLKADCGNSPISEVKHSLRRLQRKKNSGEFESIIIVGEDDSGIEHSFDFSSIIQSIEISAIKDENGHYDPQEVQSLLLTKIRW